MKRKYIILKNLTVLLFSNAITHFEVAHAHGGKSNVKSAGYWDTDGVNYSCFGKSTGLNIQSDPEEDSAILTRCFGNHG